MSAKSKKMKLNENFIAMWREQQASGMSCHFVSRQKLIPSFFLLINHGVTHAVLNLFLFVFFFSF